MMAGIVCAPIDGSKTEGGEVETKKDPVTW